MNLEIGDLVIYRNDYPGRSTVGVVEEARSFDVRIYWDINPYITSVWIDQQLLRRVVKTFAGWRWYEPEVYCW